MLPIYCDHFHLTQEPFNITPDPSFLYLSDSHKEALAQLVYGIKARRGFVVLTGEVGTGKTTLIQCLLEELNGTTKTAVLFNMIVSPKDLLRYVCEKFGLVGDQDGHREVHDYICLLERFLLESYRNRENVALIIDEAQNLSTEVLENVRLLSNFETAHHKLLQILLVGQPELSNRLNAFEVRQMKQRVALRHHLSPLNLPECREYIAKRLEIAGGSISLFKAKAVEAVHTYSGGIPRLINILCDNGLLTAYALRRNTVEAGMIAEIARDLQLTALRGNGVAGGRAVVTKPKERSYLESKESNFQLIDRAGMNMPAKSKIDQSFIEVGTRIEPAKEEVRKSPDELFHDPKELERRVSIAVESGSDAVPAEFFDRMTDSLTEAMGPMASLVIREQVSALGESLEAFPKSRLAELVEAASQDILDEPLKIRFRQVILDEIPTIDSGKEEK
jgi:type II secretory pathway predicted ATPase ExeA